MRDTAAPAKTLSRGFNVPGQVTSKASFVSTRHAPGSVLCLLPPEPEYKNLPAFPFLKSYQCPPAPSASILSSHLWLSPAVRIPLWLP